MCTERLGEDLNSLSSLIWKAVKMFSFVTMLNIDLKTHQNKIDSNTTWSEVYKVCFKMKFEVFYYVDRGPQHI